MNAAADLELAEAAKADIPALGMDPENRLEVTLEGRAQAVKFNEPKLTTDVSRSEAEQIREKAAGDGLNYPTSLQLETLQRVPGHIPWTAFTIAFIELCERFSYYGTTAVFVNFIQQPLPEGSTTGAGFSAQSGALGMGQRASTGLTTLWVFFMCFKRYC